MAKLVRSNKSCETAIDLVLSQVKSSSDSLVTAKDVKGLSRPMAALEALATLAKRNVLVRVGWGLYYLPKDTLLGKSKATQLAIFEKTFAGKFRPTLTTAANILGLTTQIPARPQFVVFTKSRPRQFSDIHIVLRRDLEAISLPKFEGAFLELIRDGGACAVTDPAETFRRLRAILRDQIPPENLNILCQATLHEPARVRTILGALLESSRIDNEYWEPLKGSLNPLSKFHFGQFSDLPNVKKWQAK